VTGKLGLSQYLSGQLFYCRVCALQLQDETS
jgi:hypothetical protein